MTAGDAHPDSANADDRKAVSGDDLNVTVGDLRRLIDGQDDSVSVRIHVDCGYMEDLRQIGSLVAKIRELPHPHTLTHDVLRTIEAIVRDAGV